MGETVGELYGSQLWSGVCGYSHDTFPFLSGAEERIS